jgi:hypothetical protein
LLCYCGGTLPQGSEGASRQSWTTCGVGASCWVEKVSLLRDAPIGLFMAREPPRSPSPAAVLVRLCSASSSSCHAPPPRSVAVEAAARGRREQRQPPLCRPPRTATTAAARARGSTAAAVRARGSTAAAMAFARARDSARAWGRRRRALPRTPCGGPHRRRFLCRTERLGRRRRAASLCVC